MIFIGNQTACWAATLNTPFEYALAQGFDAFEWFPDKKPGAGWDESDLTRDARRAIAETARARGLRLSVHARWQANPLAPEGYTLLWRDVELAQDLGAVLLNIHLFHEQGLTAFVEAVLPLVRRTAEAGLKLSVENTPHHSPEQFNELFARLRDLYPAEITHVGMCFDLGHANLCSATRNDYLRFCDRLDPQTPINHLHLHENWGDADSHLPLFTGPAGRDDSGVQGLLARLKRRGYSGAAILEQWPAPPDLLNQARDRLLQLWKESESATPLKAAREPLAPEESSRGSSAGADPASELAAGDQRCRSWREKLDFVRGLLARKDRALSADQLVDVALYLQFLNTGEIVCVEDGRHFRPAHHARIASEIHERLAKLTTADNAWIVRKIHPWLPSSSITFQRPEPLTRIRDIAHRDDIGSDLKREIKTTLQNKLHRCAGPEDLATSAALLERVTATGANYPSTFVEQFKIFHEELKEFFNARSLDERLRTLLPSADRNQGDRIRLFLERKTDHTLGSQLALLQALTSLRQGFLERAGRASDLESPEFLLADIALEDFAFALLSEIINACENAPATPAAAFETQTLMFALKNLELSGVDQPESLALERELRQWGTLSPSASREEILRLKASLLRCRRLTESFGARAVALLSGRAEKLGRALGVAEHAIRVFSESVVRGHLVFQVSKLATRLLRRIRERLKAPAWDVLVGGQATGRVVRLASLGAWDRDQQETVVVLLESAAGDEEIPGKVAGIVLAHELPHLSHLSLRARQAGVVFATCEDAGEHRRLQEFEGQTVSLRALPDQVTWEKAAEAGFAARAINQPPLTVPPVRLSPESLWIPLERASSAMAGGKAAGVRRLAELSRRPQNDFNCPSGLVVPFGVMEEALRAAPAAEAEYRELVERLERAAPADFAAATRRLRELVEQLSVPGPVLREAQRQFASTAALIVRSSANCEDLEEFAGAGLYHSVAGVPPDKVAGAIRQVWASLWTQRAALSRRDAGIPQRQAHMAVLIQELVPADYSFVLHTVHPITHDVQEVYAEIVVGLGETLASAAARGTPYRLTINKQTGAVMTLAFANFSQAVRPNSESGLRRETVDYSEIGLSRETKAMAELGRRLVAVGGCVERALGKPQDIEGAVLQDRIYLVQARPQPGLPAEKRP